MWTPWIARDLAGSGACLVGAALMQSERDVLELLWSRVLRETVL